eukprot:m.186227 g.186227  ORF g.186227 m.186227 type:complete len:52 (-) comp14751_c0_seq5:3867-4022(-)
MGVGVTVGSLAITPFPKAYISTVTISSVVCHICFLCLSQRQLEVCGLATLH